MEEEIEIDHYVILGLPSGEEGSKLTQNEISKAYRSKALELHPDKRPNDANAHSQFQKLKSSYEILKDEKARKLFDDLLHVKRNRRRQQSQFDSKRRKMMSDLEQRERAAYDPDPAEKARDEEERIAKKLKEEIARIRAMHAKGAAAAAAATTTDSKVKTTDDNGGGLDKERVLKVSWEGDGEGYSAQRLRELFGMFGDVEDVVIRSKGFKKKTRSALVVMASKDAAVAATGHVCGDLSNPLLVLPVYKAGPTMSSTVPNHAESDGPKLNHLIGTGYQAKEDSILDKLRKAAERQK